jgi:putative membrane protein
MKRLLIIACTVLASAGAFAQVGEKTGVNSALGMAPKAADFVKAVAISDTFEIESSKLAQERADAASKTFGARMVKDHTAMSTELKTIASKARFEVPTMLDSGHQSKLDKLKGLQGADFDREYDTMQVDAHKDAVDLFDRYAKSGDDKALQAFAKKHLPHLREHLKMAQALTRSGGTAKK